LIPTAAVGALGHRDAVVERYEQLRCELDEQFGLARHLARES
jgi:hypothetical protein